MLHLIVGTRTKISYLPCPDTVCTTGKIFFLEGQGCRVFIWQTGACKYAVYQAGVLIKNIVVPEINITSYILGKFIIKQGIVLQDFLLRFRQSYKLNKEGYQPVQHSS